jgi:hypothetical protein
VFLSLHTNAGGGRGTMLFYGVDTDTSPATPARPADVALAAQVHAALKQRLPAAVPGWRVNAPRPGNYSEISPFWNDAPGLLVETGEVVDGVPRRAPIEGEVEVHRDRVVVVRADDPTRTQSARLCPFGDSDFSDAGTVERVNDVPLEALGATLRVRCVFGVMVSECH